MTDATRQMRRGGHPLLEPFPLAVMTLTTFLLIFTMMMARLTAGADPALRASVNTGAISRSVASGASTITTRASGAAAAVPAVTSQGAASVTQAANTVVTRTSGAGGVSGAGDD